MGTPQLQRRGCPGDLAIPGKVWSWAKGLCRRHGEDTLGTPKGRGGGGPVPCPALCPLREGAAAGWPEGTARSPCQQHRVLQPGAERALPWGRGGAMLWVAPVPPSPAVTPGCPPQSPSRHHAFPGGAPGPQAEHLQAASCPREAGPLRPSTPRSPAPGHPAGRGWPRGRPGGSSSRASLAVPRAPGTLQAGGAAG